MTISSVSDIRYQKLRRKNYYAFTMQKKKAFFPTKGFSFYSHLKMPDFKTENLDKSELYFTEENILVIVLRKFSQRGMNLTTLFGK